MPRRTWNKLVRDRIPEILAEQGIRSSTRVLEDEEFVAALKAKLVEEAREAQKAETRDELMLELADVLEVVQALADAAETAMEDVVRVQRERAGTRGRFGKRLLLIETVETRA